MLGTGEFALPTFQALIASGHDIAGLVTQPDRTGQGHHQHAHPMKETALARGIPVFQPDKVNTPESLDRLREFRADLFVVAAYGQILSAGLLAIPRLGAINLHASLLPKYRGAAPIQYVVLNGETETGVTIFQIQPKLDAGPILGVTRTAIGSKETSGELELRLAELAVPLTLRVIDQIESGTTQATYQDAAFVTKAPKMPKSMGEIDWGKRSEEIGWHLRAMQPWPMPYTFLHVPGKPVQRMLILDADIVDSGILSPSQQAAAAGTVLQRESKLLRVRTGDAAIDLLRLQPAGKRGLAIEEFLRGSPVTAGCRFGPESP